jgi:phospholipid/cholesterol/gamma-HCH transport system permease protein
MVNSRVGSRVTAELGGMVITSQISAMKFLSVNPIQFLVVPRILAVLIATVISCIIFTIMGCIGGYLVCVYIVEESRMEIIVPAVQILEQSDIMFAMIKASTFGSIIGIISCYFGYSVDGGAVIVGSATTHTVVIATMFILFANYILTSMMF